MKLARITDCDAGECVYNQGHKCHALSITVGDAQGHKCDTYCTGQGSGGVPAALGMVGACKVGGCTYNRSYECTASSVAVGHIADEVDCLTYTPG